MFVPVNITLGAGGSRQPIYNRMLELPAKFDALGRRAENMTDPLTRVGEDLHVQMAAAFASQGATGATGKWKPLSDDYAKWKAQRGPGLPILVGLRPLGKVEHRPNKRNMDQTYATSGQMMKQMLVPVGDRTTWHITPKRLLFAPLSDIAGYHETGTDKMPARPPVDVSVTFQHSVDRTFLTWLNELMKESGLG